MRSRVSCSSRSFFFDPFRCSGSKVSSSYRRKEGRESTEVAACSTYELNVNSGFGASMLGPVYNPNFFPSDFEGPRFFLAPAPAAGKHVERTREARGLRQSGGFFHGPGDSPVYRRDLPFTPTALSASARSFLPRVRCHGNRSRKSWKRTPPCPVALSDGPC